MLKPIQPYESHLQYILQWMCDYNLYGCAFLDSKKVLFRNPVPEYEDLKHSAHMWHDHSIEPSAICKEEDFPRQSHCAMEVDISVEDITNRLDIEERRIHHNFAGQDHPFSNDQKLVHSLAGLWQDETRRRKARMGLKDSDASPFPPEVLVSVSADPRNTSPSGWIHEEEYRKKLETEIIAERQTDGRLDLTLQNFVNQNSMEQSPKTAFESVSDLFTSNFSYQSSPLAEECLLTEADDMPTVDGQAEVDETRILALQNEDFFDTDEDFLKEGEGAENTNTINGNLEDETGTLQLPGDDNTVRSGAPSEAVKDDISSAEPYSSLELESLGVRRANDGNVPEYDLFDIESEYRSNIGSPLARVRPAEDNSSDSGEPRKRRKLLNGAKEIMRRGDTAPVITGKTVPLDAGSDRERSGSEAACEANHTDRPIVLSGLGSPGNKPSSALSHIVTAKDAKKLNSPVVQGPKDPTTMQKLSQESQESQDGSESRKPQRKHVSFEVLSSSNSKDIGLSDESSLQLKNRTLSHVNLLAPAVSRLRVCLSKELSIRGRANLFCYATKPPTARHIMQTFKLYKLPTIKYQDPYYADESDVPRIEREYAGKGFKLESLTVPFLQDFEPRRIYSPTSDIERQHNGKFSNGQPYKFARQTCSIRNWEIRDAPPCWQDVLDWMRHEKSQDASSKDALNVNLGMHSQIDAATQKHKHGFKYSQKQANTSVRHETHYMSLMSLEVHVNTRGNLVPDPEKDAVSCIFWCLQADGSVHHAGGSDEAAHAGVLVVSEPGVLARKISQHVTVEIEEEETELDLITRMVDIVRGHDPDILTGFEVHNGSWGYLIERARRQYEYDLCEEFSRTRSQSHGKMGKSLDPWGFNHTSTIRITGRHMINIWRAMRGELNLLQYTMENIAFHILHRRVPHYPFKDLTRWYQSGKPRELARVVDYCHSRTRLDLEILEQNELISRTSEQARLLGVDFFSVFSRGSQFKVESLMFRIAKPENFILISPSRKQVGQQNALECLPLVMEPQSAFYPGPLLVLDFQSLYPSVMIAYNYCYSTFLGRVVHGRGQNKMGFTDFERQCRLLELLKEHINIAPNGIMYARPEVRKSLLAKMLGEILETRVMVKSGMKVDRDDRTLQRLLNNRQLALKLIANVTYGYTSASFSGRMPCSEIADSIVQTGRETLEKAIALIHSVERWGAEVVYGDTDSLFVYLKDRTRNEAFDIGKEIAKAVTSMNPKPVKLKFEKVYHPCVLLAKKRYVGFKYESKDQVKPDFDAKGIETVRRDGTPAEQKIEEKALKILFRTADLSAVKAYFQRQCTKIMKGQVSVQDFCFAREVKLGTYSDKGPPPPGALISTRRMLQDPRAEPQYGERVPYVVIAGAPGARLIDRCVAPDVLLQDDQHELDAEYYIAKNLIPPLERIFNLVGANVKQWYDEMPKFQKIRRMEQPTGGQGKELIMSRKTLESYLKNSACTVCKRKLEEAEFPLCPDCLEQPETSLLLLRQRIGLDERKASRLHEVCRSCAQLPFGSEVRCDSKDCPVFYTRTRHMALLSSNRGTVKPVLKVLESAGGDTWLW